MKFEKVKKVTQFTTDSKNYRLKKVVSVWWQDKVPSEIFFISSRVLSVDGKISCVRWFAAKVSVTIVKSSQASPLLSIMFTLPFRRIVVQSSLNETSINFFLVGA